MLSSDCGSSKGTDDPKLVTQRVTQRCEDTQNLTSSDHYAGNNENQITNDTDDGNLQPVKTDLLACSQELT